MLTKNQREAMYRLNQYVGQTVEVLTSQYHGNVDREFLARAVGGVMSKSALLGLEKKGYLKVDAFWKGAKVTVLKKYTAEDALGEI